MPTDRPLQPWTDRPAWPGRDDLLGGWVLGLLLLPWSWRRPAGNWVLRPRRLCSGDRRRVGCGVVLRQLRLLADAGRLLHVPRRSLEGCAWSLGRQR